MNKQITLSRRQINKLYSIINEFDYIDEVTIETDTGYDNEIMIFIKFSLFENNDVIDNITE